MSFSVTKLTSIQDCDAMSELVNQLKESLSVSETVDRLASKRITERAEQRNLELQKVKAESASIEAQLAVVTNPKKRNQLIHEKMVCEAKEFGLELQTSQTGVSALLLKEVEIAALVSEQQHYDALLESIATHKAGL